MFPLGFVLRLYNTEMKKKTRKDDFIRTRKRLKTKHCRRNPIKRKKYLGSLPRNMLWAIPKMDKGGTQTKRQKTRKLMTDPVGWGCRIL